MSYLHLQRKDVRVLTVKNAARQDCEMKPESRAWILANKVVLQHLVEDINMHSSDTDVSEGYYSEVPTAVPVGTAVRVIPPRPIKRLRINPVMWRTELGTNFMRRLDEVIRLDKVSSKKLHLRIPYDEYQPLHEAAKPFAKQPIPSILTRVEADYVCAAVGSSRADLLDVAALQACVRAQDQWPNYCIPPLEEEAKQEVGLAGAVATSALFLSQPLVSTVGVQSTYKAEYQAKFALKEHSPPTIDPSSVTIALALARTR